MNRVKEEKKKKAAKNGWRMVEKYRGRGKEEWKIMKVAAFKYSKGISSLDGPILFQVYLDWRLMAREDFRMDSCR